MDKTKLNDDIDKVNEFIEKAYKKSNYGSVQKVYEILKKSDPQTRLKDVKAFFENQESEQILKVQKKKKLGGHLVAYYPNEIWQMDIYDLSKFETYNKNFRYMFAIVDIFTRIAYIIPMKKKDLTSTTNSLMEVIKRAQTTPAIIMSDNDGAFLGELFQDYLTKQNIILDANTIGDHNALGIIDNFAKRIKMILSKYFIKEKSKNWINAIDEIIDQYNDTSHKSLNGLSPNEANLKENFDEILELNIFKSTSNKSSSLKPKSDLKIGDNVRVNIKGIFTKSSAPQWSENVYKVIEVRGTNIILDDGKTKKRTNLLKVSDNAQNIVANPIVEITKEARQKRLIKKSGIEANKDEKPLFEAVKNRQRKQKVFYS